MKKTISISITTYNEEENIGRLLENIKDFADEIIIIDGQSKDKTVQIARKYTKNIFIVPNNLNLNVNKQKGIKKCKSDWILYLDADEILESELKLEIKKIIENTNKTGFNIPRKNIIFGKWIRHGGHYPDYQLRLFKNGSGSFDTSSVHGFLKVTGEIGKLKNAIKHVNYYKSIHHYLLKGNNYTTNDAIQMIRSGKKIRKLSLIYKPIAVFGYFYIYKRGYKDGFYGFVLAVIHGFSHFIQIAKYFELKDKIDEKNYKNMLNNFK